jgi:hypothetical protein
MMRRSARTLGALALVALGALALARGSSFVTFLGDQQLEWTMLERTVPQLPPRATLLTAVEPGGKNIDAFPQILLARAGKLYDLVDVRRVVDGEVAWPPPSEDLLFYQGMFCYVVLDDDAAGPMTAPCRAVHEHYRVVPLLVEKLDTPGDPWQHYTGTGHGPFDVGFFRLVGTR